ncbi:hypothetical protein SAMN05428957_10856 [Oryzisolibacter propanilivorax]|uniref:Uncharacterized protein n=1 Tax=Oryzisolibacter propanilivorax TaxID=1527607 RepID=A0A1G9U9H1_9BURK|nr:hypothetical protein [Oryzisolibacter propanilivorax]SDM56601.1 hypothetical protein SAMN05428957_10856 [Oryzisolibacter propanilivorax]
MNRPLNAFESVRPRAAADAAPVRRVRSLAQAARAAGEPVVLDRLGRPMSTLAPRRFSGGLVLGSAATQADNDRRRAIVRGGI